jgi:hypothetical protein
MEIAITRPSPVETRVHIYRDEQPVVVRLMGDTGNYAGERGTIKREYLRECEREFNAAWHARLKLRGRDE